VGLCLYNTLIMFRNQKNLISYFNLNLKINPFLISEQLDLLTKLLSGRRIPGEIRHRVKASTLLSEPPATRARLSDDEIDAMHAKLNQIYSEIQILSDYCDKLDPQSSDYESHKQMAFIKQENFKKEFRVILNLLQEKQSSQQHISSDEEEGLETDVRVRLRSVSIASKNSSNNRKSR